MKKRLLALLLVLAMGLSLAACSAPAADDPNPSDNVTSSPDAGSESSSVEVDLTQDILTFAAGDLAYGDPLLTVNGNDIANSLFLYWLAFSCSYFESSYYYYGLSVADYADYILSDTCSMAAYYDMLAQKVVEYGCPLTDEQLEAAKADNGVGGEDHEMRKVLYGLTEEDLMFIYTVSYYYENLADALVPAPTQEDLNSYVYQAKHILIATASGSDDNGSITLTTGETVEYAGTVEEYNAEAQAKAQGILDQLKAASGEEMPALFDQLMNEHSQDGRDETGALAAPDGYTTTTGQMVAEFENAALALEPGQVSELVKSTYGYHIILRGEVEDIDSYADAYVSAKLDAIINQWLTDADTSFSDALSSMDVAGFYERYIAWQEAYMAQRNAETTTESK